MANKRIAVVTGAARGLGKAITKRLISDGFYVVAVDISEDGEIPVDSKANNLFEYYLADISREEEVKNLFIQLINRFGKVDAVVNNAGIIRDNVIWKMTLEDFDSVINVNLRGTWLMCREAAIIMKEQDHGKIVNIASRAWLGNPGQSNYSASKAGVVALTRVLALELGRYNITVNAVAPGLIDTPLTQNLEEDVLSKLINAQPTRTIGKAEDVANTVSFLLTADNNFITGQTIYVDGGKSIGANM
jgi:NAD(P)-dependent dehydrogenase (short-subunit alcohol dehydrogenase family)